MRAINCTVEDQLVFPETPCCLEVLRCNVLTTLTMTFVVILSAFEKLQKQMLASSCLSVKSLRPSTWNTSAPTGRISTKFDIWLFFENLTRKFNFYLYLTGITDTVHEDDYTFFIMLTSFLLRMRNISEKAVEKFITHILVSIFFFGGGWCLFRVTWRNIVLPYRAQMTMRSMRFACWITKAADKLRIYRESLSLEAPNYCL